MAYLRIRKGAHAQPCPDFNAAARSEALLSDPSRRLVTGITIDPPNARLLDDGMTLHRGPDDSYVVEISVPDVPGIIPHHSSFELAARQLGHQTSEQNIFPFGMLLNNISLTEGKKRPAVTVKTHLDSGLDVVSSRIERTVFQNLKQMNEGDIAQRLERGCRMTTGWMELAARHQAKRERDIIRLFERALLIDNDIPLPGRDLDNDGRCQSAGILVQEMVHTANAAVSTYLKRAGIDAPFRAPRAFVHYEQVSGNFDFELECNRAVRRAIGHVISALPQNIRITSPMRHYSDFLSLKMVGHVIDRSRIDSDDRKHAIGLTKEFENETNQKDVNDGTPAWRSNWARTRSIQDVRRYHLIRTDPYSHVCKLTRLCIESQMEKPLLSERSVAINGLRVSIVSARLPEPSSLGTPVAWAVDADPDYAVETAAFRLLKKIEGVGISPNRGLSAGPV